MSDPLNKPLTTRDMILVLAVLGGLVGVPTFLWWRGIGPFASICANKKYTLAHQKTIYYIYDAARSKLEPRSMMATSSMTRSSTAVSLAMDSPAIPLNKTFVGTGKEDPVDTARDGHLDAEIDTALRQAIWSVGSEAQAITRNEKVTFWSPQAVRPVRLLVEVPRRFEQGRCIFFVHVQLQREAVLSAPSHRHIDMPLSDYTSGFTTVAAPDAPQAIRQNVQDLVRKMLQNAYGTTPQTGTVTHATRY